VKISSCITSDDHASDSQLTAAASLGVELASLDTWDNDRRRWWSCLCRSSHSVLDRNAPSVN